MKNGWILSKRLPRSRLLLWKDPRDQHDLIVFIGEAQPPVRGGAFCRRIIDQAKELGVERVFTFAAMATEMRPKHESRVFSAAIDRVTLARFDQLRLTRMKDSIVVPEQDADIGLTSTASRPAAGAKDRL